MHLGTISSYHLPVSSSLKFRDYVNQWCNPCVIHLENVVGNFQEHN